MTMPDERMRAIRYGFETLNEAVCDNTLPQALRDGAQSVLRRYPTSAQLEELLAHDAATLPPDWGEALNDARCFFKAALTASSVTKPLGRAIADQALWRPWPVRAHRAGCAGPEGDGVCLAWRSGCAR
jgi:hypothetical protein